MTASTLQSGWLGGRETPLSSWFHLHLGKVHFAAERTGANSLVMCCLATGGKRSLVSTIWSNDASSTGTLFNLHKTQESQFRWLLSGFWEKSSSDFGPGFSMGSGPSVQQRGDEIKARVHALTRESVQNRFGAKPKWSASKNSQTKSVKFCFGQKKRKKKKKGNDLICTKLWSNYQHQHHRLIERDLGTVASVTSRLEQSESFHVCVCVSSFLLRFLHVTHWCVRAN